MEAKTNPGTKIAVIGSGSMGSLFAAKLSPVAEVTMLGSWVEQIQAINARGLSLIHPGGETSNYSIRALQDWANQDWQDAGSFNYALVLVKGWQTKRAAATAKHILSEDGLTLTLQNGIGNQEIIAHKVGWRRSALGVTSDGAILIEPGVVRHAGHGTTHIASTPETADRVAQLSELLNRAGFETDLVENADSLVWSKLVVNAGINPLTGLLQKPNGFLVEERAARHLMKLAALETARVAKAQGITLPFPDGAQRALLIARETATNYSSMAQDVSRGAPTEIEFITGAIVGLGRKYGVPTPINDALLLLMRRHIREGNWRSAVRQLPEQVRADFTDLINLG